jgi:hypothetical protein
LPSLAQNQPPRTAAVQQQFASSQRRGSWPARSLRTGVSPAARKRSGPGVTHGAVSRQVRHLEVRLCVRFAGPKKALVQRRRDRKAERFC